VPGDPELESTMHPCSRATAIVPSREPSSTTKIVRSSSGIASRSSARTPASVASASSAGTMRQARSKIISSRGLSHAAATAQRPRLVASEPSTLALVKRSRAATLAVTHGAERVVSRGEIRQRIDAMIALLQLENKEVSFVLTNDETIHELNRVYRR